MTSREQFLLMFHMSDYMAQIMEDYRSVLSILCHKGAVGIGEGDQFIYCVAGVIACLMDSGDEEVVRGLRFLGEHMSAQDPHAKTQDPVQFYCNKKAVFYIARPYLYCFSDEDICLMLLRDRPQYPGLPDEPYPNGFWYWIRDALAEYKKDPGGFAVERGIDGWVEDSFPSRAVHRTWLAGYRCPVESFNKARRKDRTSLLYTAPPMTEVDDDIRRLLKGERRGKPAWYGNLLERGNGNMLRLRPKKDFDCVLELFGGYGLQKNNAAALAAIVSVVSNALRGKADPFQEVADRLYGGARGTVYRYVQEGLEYLLSNTNLLVYLCEGQAEPQADADWLVKTVVAWFEDHAIMNVFNPQDPTGRLVEADELPPPIYVKRCAPPPTLDLALEAEDGART